ncbi:unnamed protein product [Camellia sinensis]
MMSDESHTSLQLPIIDIYLPLQSPSSLSSLSQACKEWGFFHISNHGVSKELYNEVRSPSEYLFSLPVETKTKLGPLSSVKTYTPHCIASAFFESLRVSGPDFAASAQSSADVLFHHHILNSEYGSKMTELSKKIVKIVLMTLGDDFENKFNDFEFNNCHGYLRINNYSPPQILEEEEEEEEVEGLGKHTDTSCVTIVYQDEKGGLQVRSKDGRWIEMNPCEGTLVVNVGDMLEAWSNGRLRSSEQRVVLKKLAHQFSLAFFRCFEDTKVVLASEEVVGEGNERVYRPFVCSDYLKFRETNEEGKFEKVGFTVKDFAGINGR